MSFEIGVSFGIHVINIRGRNRKKFFVVEKTLREKRHAG
tara:strand:+ start:199 stop:315 length:117 start_codon:yes stop_codon:yes gene_type:complete